MNSREFWYVYIVRCADDTFYTGITKDVQRRLDQHNHSDRLGAKYTRCRRPVCLAYQEPHASRSEAGRREYEIKQMNRSAKEALVAQGRDTALST